MKYLVPYDFTPITRNALSHALHYTNFAPGEIEVLHIISNENERENAERKFEELRAELPESQRYNINTKIKLGDIYKDISKEADEGHMDLLIMGTHGEKGLQRILGSNAIKVITSSKTPFIVTQGKGPTDDVKLIVVPVDLSKESIQIVRFAAGAAQRFNAEVHLVNKPVTDEFLKVNLQNNITLARKHLNKEGVKSDVIHLDGHQSFHKEVIDYGAKVRADLFAIAHHPESLLPQFDRFSQEMITNKFEIPVLIVNTHEVAGVKMAYSFIGI